MCYNACGEHSKEVLNLHFLVLLHVFSGWGDGDGGWNGDARGDGASKVMLCQILCAKVGLQSPTQKSSSLCRKDSFPLRRHLTVLAAIPVLVLPHPVPPSGIGSGCPFVTRMPFIIKWLNRSRFNLPSPGLSYSSNWGLILLSLLGEKKNLVLVQRHRECREFN